MSSLAVSSDCCILVSVYLTLPLIAAGPFAFSFSFYFTAVSLSPSSSVSAVVNVSRSQLLFTSLVSVEVQEDQLINQALQDKLLLAPPTRCHGNKAVDGPSLLPFMTSDLLRQKPLPKEEDPVNVKARPSTHHARSTFDLYRRQRRCEATP